MLRLFFTFILLLLTSALFAQAIDVLEQDPRLEKKYSLSIDGAPFGEALPKISKQVHVSLTAGSNVTNDVFVLFTHDLPLKDAMRKIASHFHFSWERGGKAPDYSYKLYQAKSELDAEKVLREKDLKVHVTTNKKLIKEYAEYANTSIATLKKQAMIDVNAAIKTKSVSERRKLAMKAYLQLVFCRFNDRLLMNIISGFNNSQWQDLINNREVAYSTQPLYNELTLTSELIPILQTELNKQYNAAVAEDKKQKAIKQIEEKVKTNDDSSAPNIKPEAADPSGLLSTTPDANYFNMSKYTEDEITIETVRIRFRVEDSGLVGHVFLYDKNSAQIEGFNFDTEYMLDSAVIDIQRAIHDMEKDKLSLAEASKLDKLSDMMEMDEVGTDETDNQVEKTDPLLKIKINALKSAPKKEVDPSTPIDVIEDLQLLNYKKWFNKKIETIETVDPISWLYGAYLSQIAYTTHLNLISDGFDYYGVVLNQMYLMNITDDQLDDQSLGKLMNKFEQKFDCTIAHQNGWLSFHSDEYYNERPKHVSRNILRNWYRKLKAQGYFTIDDLSSIASSLSDSQLEDDQSFFHTLIFDNVFLRPNPTDLSVFVYRETLRLYSLLTDEQKSKLLNGETLKIDELPRPQLNQVSKILTFIITDTEGVLKDNEKFTDDVETSTFALRLTVTQKPAFFAIEKLYGEEFSRRAIDEARYNILKHGSLYDKSKRLRPSNYEGYFEPAIQEVYSFDFFPQVGGIKSVLVQIYKKPVKSESK